jgi:SET domain-containing protein
MTQPSPQALQELPASQNPNVEIRESGIHGLGLFATRRLRKGEVIGVYDGPRVLDEEDDGDHVLWIYDEEEDLEYGIDGQNETRFVNHSRRPNACFEGAELVALTTIREGEEITHDYGEAWSDIG